MFSSMRTRWLTCLLQCGLWISYLQPSCAFATEPFPPTVVWYKDYKWQLQSEYLGGSRIFVIDANKKTLLWIKDALPNDEYIKYVHETTAGPLWESNALSYFMSLNGKPHFCIRTWWDRRILIELEAAKQVPDRPFDKDLTAFEKQHALDLLKSGVTLMAKKENCTRNKVDALHGAVDLAGRMKLKEAVPFLRRLEPVDYSGSAVGGGDEIENLRQEDINPASYSRYETRTVVQRSLRQLGEKPTGYPATQFHYHRSRKEVEPTKLSGPRRKGVSRLEIAMNPIDVFNVLGPPDYVERGKDLPGYVWRYDMDTAVPYSLLVHWNEKNPTVAAFEKVEPALWAGNDLIDPGAKQAVFNAEGSIVWMYEKVLYSSAFKGKITRLKRGDE